MKYECDMIRDLMPLCADGMASAASEQMLEAHLAECETCTAEWKSIKEGAEVFPETEVPEETRQYAKTAKRVRKKHILALAGAALAAVAAVFGHNAYKMHSAGGRLSPEKAALRYAEIDSWETNGGSFPSWYAMDYYMQYADDLDSYQPPAGDFTPEVICTEKGAHEARCFLKYTDAKSGRVLLEVTNAVKYAGLWFGYGSYGGIEVPNEPTLCSITDPLTMTFATHYYFYVSDPNVAKIELTANETEYVDPELYQQFGAGIQGEPEIYTETFEITQEKYPEHIVPAYYGQRITSKHAVCDITGTAYDAAGNVLYTMTNNEWTRA